MCGVGVAQYWNRLDALRVCLRLAVQYLSPCLLISPVRRMGASFIHFFARKIKFIQGAHLEATFVSSLAIILKGTVLGVQGRFL